MFGTLISFVSHFRMLHQPQRNVVLLQKWSKTSVPGYFTLKWTYAAAPDGT